MGSIEITTPKAAVVLVAVIIVAGGAGAAVTIMTLGVSPVAPGAGTLTGSDVLSIDSQELQYTGNDVEAVNVTVNNTDSSSHTVDLYVALENTTSGEVVASETVTDVTVAASSTETTTVTLTNSTSVSEFDRVEVNVEQTG